MAPPANTPPGWGHTECMNELAPSLRQSASTEIEGALPDMPGTFRLRALPAVTVDTAFTSEREWINHLRILAELPYPSLALMPSILAVVRCRLIADLCGFGWTDQHLSPRSFMTEYMNEGAYRWWVSNLDVAFRMFPIKVQLEGRGNIIRHACTAPGFEESDFCREILVGQGMRWMALAPASIAGGQGYGFMSVYRELKHGPYTDEEQSRLACAVEALAALDSPNNPLAALPPCALKESDESKLLIRADGTMAARSMEAMRLIYLLGGANMFTLEWARPDWLALPDQIRATAQALFRLQEHEARRRIRIDQSWGRFDFVLEKMSDREIAGAAVVMIGIRYHEPIDITVARRLAGWPLSPREKRILVAATRTANLAELAEALGITVNTLKSYNKELVDRLGVESRQALIDLLLSDEAAHRDLRNRQMV